MKITIHSRSSNADKTSGKTTYIDENEYALSISTDEWKAFKCGPSESHPWHITVTGNGRYNIGSLVDRSFQLDLNPNDVQNLLSELTLRGLLSTKVIITEPAAKKVVAKKPATDKINVIATYLAMNDFLEPKGFEVIPDGNDLLVMDKRKKIAVYVADTMIELCEWVNENYGVNLTVTR